MFKKMMLMNSKKTVSLKNKILFIGALTIGFAVVGAIAFMHAVILVKMFM